MSDEKTVESLETRIARVREWLSAAQNVMVITGAGVSAESGVPRFRTADGLWRQFNPMEYATPEAFHQDPVKVWEWYDLRRQEIVAARPNPAHAALARLEEEQGKKVFIVTQNVDGLHERAGSKQVVHLHGSIWRLRCERDGNIVENREGAAERDAADLFLRQRYAPGHRLVRRGAALAAFAAD